MNSVSVTAVSVGDEYASSCSCCGRPIYSGAGELRSTTSVLADYWYRWAEGHEGRFSLAIAIRDATGEPIEDGGVVAVSGRVDPDNIVYSVLSPEDSPWSDFGVFGKVIERNAALAGAESTDLFQLVDAISANENRLSSRILTCGIKA